MRDARQFAFSLSRGNSTISANLSLVKHSDVPPRSTARRFAPPADAGPAGQEAPRDRAPGSAAGRGIQRAAALALAGAWFLPLASCQGNDTSAATAYPADNPLFAVVAFLFFWPLAFEATRRWTARRFPASHRPLWRLLLAGASVLAIGALVHPVTMWGGRLRYGVAVALVSLAAYAAAAARRRPRPG